MKLISQFLPTVGLDPPTLRTLSTLLHRLALANAPRLVLSLRVQDPLPDWITHIIYLNQDCTVAVQGRKEEVLTELRRHFAPAKKPSAADDARSSIYSTVEIGRTLVSDDIGIDPAYRSSNATSTGLDETQEGSFILGEPPSRNTVTHDEVNKKPYYARLGLRPYGKQALELAEGDLIREPLVKMEGVCVKYGKKKALGGWKKRVNREIVQGLWWTVRRGDRWGVFGPNGKIGSKFSTPF